MEMYKSKVRTTLHDMDELPTTGVYVVAYMGKIVYVGKTNYSVFHRLENHLRHRDREDFGGWMYKVRDDWHNVRLDVLETPDNVDAPDYWLRTVEGLLVKKFKPLFNDSLNS